MVFRLNSSGDKKAPTCSEAVSFKRKQDEMVGDREKEENASESKPLSFKSKWRIRHRLFPHRSLQSVQSH